jgi:hypothetical protein
MAPDFASGASRHVEKSHKVSIRSALKPFGNIGHAGNCGAAYLIA